MKQDMKTLNERTVQQGRRRSPVFTPPESMGSTILPGSVVSVDAGGVYTVELTETGGVQFQGVAPLLDGVTFAANDPVALLFQRGEKQPAILATGGGFDPNGIVYIITGQMGFVS
jgi:hypothetical protein